MARKIAVEIVGDSRSLERAFDRSAKSARNFNGQVSRAGRGRSAFGGLRSSVLGLATAFAGPVGLAVAARSAFSEMAESQKVAAQTQAVLKSTGAAANVTAKHVDELAQSLLNKSGIDDEAIKSGENLLLTFTNIRNEAGKGNDVFDQATRSITDMSVALGEDMKSAAIQVGKALQDPVKGVTALRRVGVQFTDAQKDQIKALVASGHQMEAQKIILKELQREFGGSAEAAGRTLPGKLNILRENVKNLGGAIAEVLTPSITRFVDQAVKWIQNTRNQQQVLSTVKQVAGAFATVLATLRTIMGGLNKITGSTKNTLLALAAVFTAFKVAKLAGSLLAVASNIGLIGTEAGVAASGVAVFVAEFVALAAAGFAAYKATRWILKATHLEDKLKDLGGAIYDATHGDVGKPISGKAARFIRNQAARLEARGMTPKQAADRLAATHPGLNRRDIGILAGVGRGGVVITGPVTINGVRNVKELENQLTKRAGARGHNRRGAR